MRFSDLSDPRDRTLHGVLRRQAEANPNATYLHVDDERISYAEVLARSNAWAAALRELGVARGDSVAFLLKSSPDFVYATFGCLQLRLNANKHLVKKMVQIAMVFLLQNFP